MSQSAIEAVFVGRPKLLGDAQGSWQSSICRERKYGSVQVSERGIVGDRVTQPYHGGLDAALCVHLNEHYDFWSKQYAVDLPAGAVGENFTVSHLSEQAVCVGDVVRLGTVLAQVSGPRVPCANQARHIGRSDWVKLTIRENRTGFYLRVLEGGAVEAGAPWIVEQRLNVGATIPAINQCMYLNFDEGIARRMSSMSGLGEWWKDQAQEKLRLREQHWTSALRGPTSISSPLPAKDVA